ncbi:MAG: SAM-dependent methyltransferase [Bacillota bacterium]
MSEARGALYLVPCWLSAATPPQQVLAGPVLERIRALDAFVVENAKSARAFLAACGHPRPMREIAMTSIDADATDADLSAMLEPVRAGNDLGVLSEAGVPAVADPGARLVEAAHAEGIRVVPLVGPSSILLALMASGLEGQRFRFAGYLPAQSGERRERVRALERQSALERETQVFIETPYRNDALLADLLETCKPDTRLCVAADLTSASEWIRSDRVERWRAKPDAIGKRPAIFLILAAARR